MRIKAQIEVEVSPFRVPSTVATLDESGNEIPLRSLSPETLSLLCYQFRKDVFAVAEKSDPTLPQPYPKSEHEHRGTN